MMIMTIIYVSVAVLRIVHVILILHNNNMRCRYYPNSRNEETASERLCSSLKVIYYYVMKPRFEPLLVRLHNPYS